ncbi:hypothetical protein SRABI98_01575 [Microbacterium sp. Bi98]|nr:hypothetical protein SRABI98_01575 [Microbacterium sp. Bi98]
MCAGRASHFSIAPRFDSLPPFTTLRPSSNSMPSSRLPMSGGTADQESWNAIPSRPGSPDARAGGALIIGAGEPCARRALDWETLS